MRGVKTMEVRRDGAFVLIIDAEPGGEWGDTFRETVLAPDVAIRLGEGMAAIGRAIIAEKQP